MAALSLNLNMPVSYGYSSFRSFLPHERHIDRICQDDVLILMLDGVLRFTEAETNIALKQGDWYIQRSGLVQRGKEESLSPRYYYVHFSGCFEKTEAGGLPVKGRFLPSDMLDAIERLATAQQHPSATAVGKTAAFYEILLRLLHTTLHEPAAPGQTEKMLQYLCGHFQQPLSIQKLAKQFGYSYDHFIRVFRDTYRITPGKYLSALRMAHGKSLLSTSSLSVQQIALACGYLNVTDFYRAFKKDTGVSPSGWRTNQRHSLYKSLP